jgi:glycosyltransferase involved in cell wall biosynthesis
MEAMATQLPVVATRIAGIPELVEDGHNGMLVAPGRSDLLAVALTELIRDPSRREVMGRAARERIAKRFELRRCAMQLQEVMEEYGAFVARSDGRRSGEPVTASARSWP